MRVTQVAIRPTDASERSGRPSLTPELLAACGARYSRSNEGLESVIAKIDLANMERSVDSVFRFIDYGHQSIADMAPVAMFIDGISIWLAYHVWKLCPTAGGQETSTRYIRVSSESLVTAEDLGVPDGLQGEWAGLMGDCFGAYDKCLRIWQKISADHPEATFIPEQILQDPSEKAQKQAARMRRNYAYDRARYYLPAAAATNMMLVMSARGWVQLCQHLLSHPLSECRTLGSGIRGELEMCAPRMVRHAVEVDSIKSGLAEDFARLSGLCGSTTAAQLDDGANEAECEARASLEMMLPSDITSKDIADSLRFHDNRYAWIGAALARLSVRFGWDAVAFAEIRDLNRHRTGQRHCDLVPRGFYSAMDQLPDAALDRLDGLSSLSAVGRAASTRCRSLLREGNPAFVYWILLGTQFPFEHTTTGDKLIYEAELRTGTGSHFRYAKHLHDLLELWYQRFPDTRGLVLEGVAEPESM